MDDLEELEKRDEKRWLEAFEINPKQTRAKAIGHIEAARTDYSLYRFSAEVKAKIFSGCLLRKVFLTKYVLSSGIYLIPCWLTADTGRHLAVDARRNHNRVYDAKDAHISWDKAKKRAERMVQTRIKTLRKNLNKLESIVVEEPSRLDVFGSDSDTELAIDDDRYDDEVTYWKDQLAQAFGEEAFSLLRPKLGYK